MWFSLFFNSLAVKGFQCLSPHVTDNPSLLDIIEWVPLLTVGGCVLDDNKIFEIPKKRIGIRSHDLIQRIVLFVEDTKMSKIEHWLILQFGRLA